jgi:hypothetical protein
MTKILIERLNLKGKNIDDMSKVEYAALYQYKTELMNKGKIKLSELTDMTMTAYFLKSELVEQNISETLTCSWHRMAGDESSTTFADVRADNPKHGLWSCAYNCQGLDFKCIGYIPPRDDK